MRARLAAVVAAGIGGLVGDGEVARGKRFEARAPTNVRAAKLLRWAEETGNAFEDLVGSFPGKKAGVDQVGILEARPPAAPPPGLDWNFTFLPAPPGAATGARVPRAPDETTRFRHHLGHRLLAEWTARLPDGGPKPDGSGCALPDWFEEAVAVDMEPAYRKKDYLKALGELARAGSIGKVGDFLAEQRPKGRRGGALPDLGELPPGIPGEVRRWIRGPAEADDHAEGIRFEVVAWGLLEFLRREYGVPFLRHVAETFGANRGFGNAYPWLEKHRADLRDPSARPPGTDRELDAAFQAWAKAR